MKLIINLVEEIKSRFLMPIEQYLANAANLIKSGYRTNAFAPYVWKIGVVLAFSLAFYLATDDVAIRYGILIFDGIIVFFGCIIYIIIFAKDPKLLQSESFRLEEKKLDIISQKGGPIKFNPVSVVLIEALEEGGRNE